MKILLDENLDHRLRKLLGLDEIYTVAYKGWAGLKNGQLLKAAEADGIDVLLTGDQTLVPEQGLAKRRLAIVVLSSVETVLLKQKILEIGIAVGNAAPGTVQYVDCGKFSRKVKPEAPSPLLTALFTAAAAAQARAYAPYSRFRVGAAIAAASGAIYPGCNVENAAYPVGSCAEAGAIAAMVAGGETRIREILIIGDGEALVTPCGACRQRIREFAGPDAMVHIAGPEGIRASFTLSALLPHAFGPDNLDNSQAVPSAPKTPAKG